MARGLSEPHRNDKPLVSGHESVTFLWAKSEQKWFELVRL